MKDATKAMSNVTLSKKQREELLRALKARFEKHMDRHQGLEWAKVQARLDANAEKLWSLCEMDPWHSQKTSIFDTRRDLPFGSWLLEY
jgi:hypothetical protein